MIYESGLETDYDDFVSRVAALVKVGMRNGEIAKEVGATYGRVESAVRKARKEGFFSKQRFYDLDPLHVVITAPAAFNFVEEAKDRGLTATQLAQRIVDMVARDDLFRAILGDPPKLDERVFKGNAAKASSIRAALKQD